MTGWRGFFGLHDGADVRREVIAGLTTFATMAYITVVNPALLSDAGMDAGAVFVATCLAAAIGSTLMGVLGRHPIALAPGMGLNAYFAYAVVGAGLASWQTALGAVFVSGVLFLALSLLPVRAWVVDGIPASLQHGITAGIGLFLGFIGLKNAQLVVDHPVTLVTIGDLGTPAPWLALLGVAITIGLVARRVPGAVLIAILTVTAVAMGLGLATPVGLVALPPDPSPTLGQLDIVGALDLALWPVVLAFLFVDLFDTTGTLLAVAHQGDLLDDDGHLPRLRGALLADSGATVAGAVLGTSTTTSYIESAAGIAAGGRTGLTAVVVGLCFVAALAFAPLAQSIPPYATAPALLFVAAGMARSLRHLPEDATDAAPAIVAALAIPLTFSIAEGIGLGAIVHVVGKVLAGRWRDAGGPAAVIAGLYVLQVVFLH